ncbi:MAG: family 43 glycosylhydrolase, partial [Chthoniobacterales bacterium]|nr:family 43 glycosylhydrolase [Chthoniobacterales bacterium]
MPRRTFATKLFLISCLAATSARADRFVLATFNNGEQQLRILSSTNADSFDGYQQGVAYTPTPGNNLRDPSIISHGGRYYVCHTTGDFGAAAYFSVLVSDDLRAWTQLANVPMTGMAGIQRTWAPEWFRDEDETLHILVSATTNAADMSNNHVIYVLRCLDNETLSSWSAPTPVTGNAFGWTGNEGRRVGAYDPYVVKRGSNYFMFYFNQ